MSLTDNGNNMIMPVSPMYGDGNGTFGGNDGAWWLLILLFALGGGNWGGYGNGNGGACGEFQNEMNRSFDTAAITGQLSGIQSSVSNGFANAEISACGRAQNLNNVLSSMQMAQQQCCCDNRAAIADLKYTVATEACADRSAISDGARDIIANQNAGIQTILDKLCQQEIEALKTQNANLQTQLNMANLAASQNAQTGQLLADNARQTAALEQYLNPAPIPAYVVQNPNCCSQNVAGCGCGF